ncbi:transferrin-binding protein [Histophilus somni]|uniref:Transferrin-binding protein B n=1 Tax=Histophilus somni TaxID=731 RepID=A0A9Q6YYZ5_HISSO|nr:transferrin-binding protein-like solute binding protein [Histophilus somni]ARU69072.1 transferrin-binding protein [Histophilus somni]QQF81956.1 transferrin-binding protein-like solute binding protein [Histophilus somni]
MTSFKLLGFSVLSVALLSACSSGKGGFDLDDVEHTPPSSSGSSRPTYQDVPTEQRQQETVEEINQPALGYATEIPRRNFLDDTQPSSITIAPDKVKAIGYPLEEVMKIYTGKIKEDKDKILKPEANNLPQQVSYSHDQQDFKYVRFGYVVGESKFKFNREKRKLEFQPGFTGYVFYQGHKPTTILPTHIVEYKGHWEFVSNADKDRKDLPEDFTTSNFSSTPGVSSGATSLDLELNRKETKKPMGLTATFNADFSSKKLTGSLTSNGPAHVSDQKIKERYKIDADIKGNRFRGSATATESGHTIFGKNSPKNLEGGFFGPKAEELAGKFLTDDNSLFVVFGAKRESKGDEKLETRFDAVKISTDRNELKKETMDTFGNASYLVLDGRQFPLVPESNAGTTGAGNTGKNDFITTIDGSKLSKTNHDKHKNYKVTVCCSNLVYVKFGSYGEQTTANGASNSTAGAATTHNGTSISQLTNGHLFLTGERTPMADMMKQKDQNVHYRGIWQANFLSSNGQVGSVDAGDPRNDSGKSRAEFDVNFGGKTVTGKFFDANGTQPALTMENATITGNGFSGTAKTTNGGFSLDNKATTGGTKVNITADISGAFYGPNANEIGGTITSNGAGDKVGGVFGAKRQEPSK